MHIKQRAMQASQMSRARLLYPNAVIRPVIGIFGVKFGNFGGAGVVAVDQLVIGDTTYDFEASTTPAASNCGSFTDVAAGDSYCGSVEWLKNRGVTTGCTGTTYLAGRWRCS
jgi:hypothetical protein